MRWFDSTNCYYHFQALIQCGALTNLSRCELFKMRPSIRECSDTMFPDEDNSEDIHSQYMNIVQFAVQLTNNILSTLGNNFSSLFSGLLPLSL